MLSVSVTSGEDDGGRSWCHHEHPKTIVFDRRNQCTIYGNLVVDDQRMTRDDFSLRDASPDT